jgi:NTE family protein
MEELKMLAFVLSGAGNRGPLEVGALRALVEAGHQPDILVGTSAGAINAAYLAAWGVSLETIDTMADLWRSVTTEIIYPQNAIQVAWRLRGREASLFTSDGLRQLIEDSIPPDVSTFADLSMPLYVTATDLQRQKLFIFGDDERAPLTDAVLASASVPCIHPPVTYEQLQLVDGGALANVPSSIAMDKGATTLYVVNAGYGGGQLRAAQSVLEVFSLTLSSMMSQSMLQDLDRAAKDDDVDLYHIHLGDFGNLSFRDFSKTDEMIEAGYRRTKAFLASPAPAFLPAPKDAAPPSPYGESVGAAEEYIPPYLR